MKSLLIRLPTKSIRASRSFSIDSNGLWKMPCNTVGSPYLPKYALLKQTPCCFLEIRYVSNLGGPWWPLAHGAHSFPAPLGKQTGSAGKGLLGESGLDCLDKGLMPHGEMLAGK